MSEIATIPQRREVQSVIDAVPIMDTARFEHFQRVANIMARSSMIPESLRTIGPKDAKQDLPFEQVLSNCFLVVNQAARWGMDPFATISCCSVVHGRLAYEGKLVAAVIDAKLGIKLHHHFVGDTSTEACRIYLSDQPFTPELIAQLKPGIKIPGVRLWDGSVAEWKTTGAGTPWTPKNYPRMLIYRGTRDWTRIYEPAVLLGVYTDDELMDLADDARARRAVPVSSLTDRLAAAKAISAPAASGFSVDHVHAETQSQAKEPEASRGNAQGATPEVRVGGASADLSATSEPMDVTAGETAPDSNSSHPPCETDTPATVSPQPPTAVAGNSSDPSGLPAPDDGSSEDGPGDASPSSPPLPDGWAIAYAGALRRAQKKDSLPKYASQFWQQYGGWDAHKDGQNAPTAKAIFDAFVRNFGNKDAIDAELREII